MARNFKLPDLGEGIHEAEIIQVMVSVGDQLEEGDSILVVETDKAAVEIPSPYTGEVVGIEVEEGQLVHVGDLIMSFSGGEDEPVEESSEPEEKEGSAPESTAPQAAAEAAPQPRVSADRPVPASPSTRRLARELKVDLHRVTPTGDAGRVTADDVRAFAEGGGAAPSEKEQPSRQVKPAPPREMEDFPDVIPSGRIPSLPDFNEWGETERVPLRSVRRATARQMALSWSQIPHVNHHDIVDITALEEFRKKHKNTVEKLGGNLTPTVFAMKAVVAALKAHPRFNASLDPVSEEIILKKFYNIGIAADTDRGLLVPVIKDVDRKSITQLSIELSDLVKRTRDGQASLDELQGGTFTITNIGILGGTGFSPIINFPEVAILGMARARWEKVVIPREDGRFETQIRYRLPLILAIDHRVVDGADAARFMNTVKEALETPDNMLLMM